MTVCIAAICETGHTIVAASDKMLSMGSGFTSADSMALKWEPFFGRWSAMFSGDVSAFQPILRRVKKRLTGQQELDSSTEAVSMAFEAEYAAARRRKAEQEVLSIYGLDTEGFLLHSGEFDPATAAALRQRIDSVDLGIEFLVFGFDESDVLSPARIFTVSPPNGTVADFSLSGFWAIGSGQDNALSILYFYPYAPHTALLPEALYHVCEAKFMAESALGVGKDTSLFVYRSNGALDYIAGGPDPLVDLIRDRWEKFGKPRVPETIYKDVTDCWIENKGLPFRYRPKKED